ncbi:MAG: hypothetical protein CM15mV26_0340 [uncultured marine virus]|nr:MAG: hypothetical protein CM15mV26_0340 [uncultured marine virus]
MTVLKVAQRFTPRPHRLRFEFSFGFSWSGVASLVVVPCNLASAASNSGVSSYSHVSPDFTIRVFLVIKTFLYRSCILEFPSVYHDGLNQ